MAVTRSQGEPSSRPARAAKSKALLHLSPKAKKGPKSANNSKESGRKSGPRKLTAANLRKKNVMMDDRLINRAIDILNKHMSSTGATISDIFFFEHVKSDPKNWLENRGHFNPNIGGNAAGVNGQLLQAKLVMVPVHFDDHFSCVIRFEAKEEKSVKWELASICSLNDYESCGYIKNIINDHTTLPHSPEYISDEVPSEDRQNSEWSFVPCVAQEELECGPRTVLHLYVASLSTDLLDFKAKIEGLGRVDGLASKVRHWIADLLTPRSGGPAILENPPEWLVDALWSRGTLDPINANALAWSAQGEDAMIIGASPEEMAGIQGAAINRAAHERREVRDVMAPDLLQIPDATLLEFRDGHDLLELKRHHQRRGQGES